MASPCELLMEFVDEAAARAVLAASAQCAWRIEGKFSRYRDDNIVARINGARGLPVDVDEETANLLDFTTRMHGLSEGLFDITSGILRRAWTFDGGERTPSRAELDELLPLVGWNKVRWDRPRITLQPGMQIDFGGVGKEFAVDQAVRAAGDITSEPVLINFGGDLAVTRARHGDRAWRIGIESASVKSPLAADVIELFGGALATSGDTHRFITVGGRRLPHILDPRDGRPVRDAPHSVTVAAPTCVQAGMLTTLAMLRGAQAEEFLRAENVRNWIQRD